MDTYNGYPLVYLNVDDDIESRFAMDAIALVDQPATELGWFTFAKETQYQFKTIDAEKRMFTAVVMLADTPIERYNKTVGKYYTVFTPQAIERMMKKYFMQNKIHQVNEMHQGSRFIDGVYMIESYQLTDRVESKLFDVPQGTWIATFYCEDEEYWQENIVSGKYQGISLEGSFDIFMDPEQTYAVKNSTLDSANVDKIQYDSKTRTLVVRFHEGDVYTYGRVSPAIAEQILRGQAECVTSGESAWGSWEVGKTPSLGAAIHKFLVKRNHPFTRGGSFFRIETPEEAAWFLIEEILKRPISDSQKVRGIQDILRAI